MTLWDLWPCLRWGDVVALCLGYVSMGVLAVVSVWLALEGLGLLWRACVRTLRGSVRKDG